MAVCSTETNLFDLFSVYLQLYSLILSGSNNLFLILGDFFSFLTCQKKAEQSMNKHLKLDQFWLRRRHTFLTVGSQLSEQLLQGFSGFSITCWLQIELACNIIQ